MLSLPQSKVPSESTLFFNTSSEAEVIQKAQWVIRSANKKSIPDKSKLNIIEDFVRSYNGFIRSTNGDDLAVSEGFRDTINEVIQTIGGYDSPLMFTKHGLYYIPDLWKLITKRLRESGHSAFKLHRIWFAIQGEKVRLAPKDVLLIKINTALKMTNIPLSCRKPYFMINPKAKIANRGFNPNIQYQKALRSLLVPATQSTPDLKQEFKDSNGKRVRILTYIRRQSEIRPRKRFFTLKYDEELISSALRLSFKELAVKRTEATDLAKLFSSNPSLWTATRNPYDTDFTFLVAIENKSIALMNQIEHILEESWAAEAESPSELLSAARTRWPNGTLGPVVDTKKTIQLSFSEILESFPVWTYQESLQSGFFDRYVQKKKKLPLTISNLMVENGGGPLNFLLQALWANCKFRHAVNENKCLLSSARENSYSSSEFIGNLRVGKSFGKLYPGQTTVFYPDSASNCIPELGNVEFVLFKNASEVDSSLIVLDELKAINTIKTPYRTFQFTVYTNKELTEIERKTGNKFDTIQNKIRSFGADGLIIFSYSDDFLMDLDWLGEIANSGYIKWRKEYYRKKPPKESIDSITNQIITHMQQAQPCTEYNFQMVKKIVNIMDFNADTKHQFIETIWWHWVWEWISCMKSIRQIDLEVL